MPDLEITATGNVQGAVTALKRVGNGLEELAVSAKASQSALQKTVPAVDQLYRALSNVPNAATKASFALGTLSASITKIPTPFANTVGNINLFNKSIAATPAALSKVVGGANQATGAMINLGRVVQDAPFGFLGIANNLNPLLESFQRLKAETGSTGGALKALGNSLLGAGGIGFAISLLSAGLSLFALNSQKAGKEVEGAKKKVDEFTESVKNLSQYQNDFAKSFAEELSNLRILRGVIEDVNKPMNVRLQAVRDIKKEFPEYFKGLSQEAILAGAVGKAYERATIAIIQKAKASAATKEVEKLYDEINRLEIQRIVDYKAYYKKAEVIAKTTNDEIRKANALGSKLAPADQGDVKKVMGAIKEIGQFQIKTEFDTYLKGRQLLDKQIEDRKKQADQFIDIAIKNTVFDPAKEPKPVKVKKIKVEPDKIEIINSAAKELYFGEPLGRITGAELSPTLVLTPKLQIEISPEEQQKVLDAFNKFLLNEKLKEAINASIDTLINDTINTVASAVGEALAGNQDALPALFDGLIKGIGGQISELGKYLVKVGIEMLAAKKAVEALGLTPQGAVIAGIGLQILGSLLKAAATKKTNQTGFASGGTVGEGGFYNVGERGQERIFLPQGTRVQPNNEVMAYGGDKQVVEVVGVISGDNIRLIQDRTAGRWNRNN